MKPQRKPAAPGNTIAPACILPPTSSSDWKHPACSRRCDSRCRRGRRPIPITCAGRIEVDHEQIEDFVILRSNGLPIYHLSVVADDIEMGITHVIRGDDHISNTPKHILLWQALGRTPPEFAHVPLILGTDKKKLSKRHGITSVTEYERIGYLADAMVNFLALLGWSPGGDREVMSRDEMIAAFSLEGISGGAAVFDPEKLDWFNAQYLAQLRPGDLVRYVKPLLQAAGLWSDELRGPRAPRMARARACDWCCPACGVCPISLSRPVLS